MEAYGWLSSTEIIVIYAIYKLFVNTKLEISCSAMLKFFERNDIAIYASSNFMGPINKSTYLIKFHIIVS